MKLSTRAKYGLKALIDLGLYSEKEAVSLQSIAGRQNISVSYLEQLMALLKKAGLVKSVRGAAGGYFLGRPAEEISVGDILRVLEGGLEAATCPGTEGDGGCQGSDGIPREKIDQFTGFAKTQTGKLQTFAKQAVFPQGASFDPADQA